MGPTAKGPTRGGDAATGGRAPLRLLVCRLRQLVQQRGPRGMRRLRQRRRQDVRSAQHVAHLGEQPQERRLRHRVRSQRHTHEQARLHDPRVQDSSVRSQDAASAEGLCSPR